MNRRAFLKAGATLAAAPLLPMPAPPVRSASGSLTAVNDTGRTVPRGDVVMVVRYEESFVLVTPGESEFPSPRGTYRLFSFGETGPES